MRSGDVDRNEFGGALSERGAGGSILGDGG